VRTGSAFLNVCDQCGAYWEFASDGAVAIEIAEARRRYPEYFR
jgi:hypothetical protein